MQLHSCGACLGVDVLGAPPPRPPSLVGFLCRAHYVGQWLLGSAYSSKPHAHLLMVSVSAEGTHTGFLGCLDTHRKSL